MNQIESRVDTIEHTYTVTIKNEDGTTSKETTTSYARILHITVSSKTAEQQDESYHFTNEQIDIMKELMSGEIRLAMLVKKRTLARRRGQHLPEGELGSEVVKLV